jgi:hypothetical protein
MGYDQLGKEFFGFLGEASDTATLPDDLELIPPLENVPDGVEEGRGAIHQNSDFARRHVAPSVRKAAAALLTG